MNIKEIREKYPQYSDLSDAALVKGLHNKFYPDMKYDDFLRKIDFTGSSVDPGKVKSPLEDMSGTQTFLAGAGKAFSDIGRGAAQIVGAGPSSEQVKQIRSRDAELMNSGAGMAGNLAGNVAATLPVLAIPGANTYTGAALLGGALNAAQPLTDEESRMKEIGKGALFGAGGQAAGKLVGRVLSPQTSAEAKDLLKQGVKLTPGQILGGMAQRAEDAATSVPVLGDFIKGAQRRGIESFNDAAVNRSLAPIGVQLPKGIKGNEAIGFAQDALGEAYENLLPKMKGDLNALRIRTTPPTGPGQSLRVSLADELNTIREMGSSLPEPQMGQLNRIIDKEVINRFTPQGLASGETLKNIESKLGVLAKEFGKSDNYDVRTLGGAVEEIQAALRRMVRDVNPQHADELAKINQGYANFKRVQRAASAVGAKEGTFTPAQLQNAVKALDRSKDKAKFARGEALMQDLSNAGKSALSQTVPDSGTPFRLLNALLLGGGAAIHPALPIAAAGASALYTKPMQAAMAKLLVERPELARQLAPYMGKIGTASMAALGTQQ